MVDNTAAFMALDRQSQGAIAPYQSGVDMSQSRAPMLALLNKVNVMFPWAPGGLATIGAQVFDLGGFPRLRAYLPGGGARPAWLADEARYQQWAKMIHDLYRPIDSAFLAQNSALTAAETQAAAGNVAFWDTVYNTTDVINMASPIRIASNLRDTYRSFADAYNKHEKLVVGTATAVAVSAVALAVYFKFFRKRK